MIAKMKREIFGPPSERSHGSSRRWNCGSRACWVGEDAAKLAATSVQLRGWTRHKATGYLLRRRIVHPISCPCCDGTGLSKSGEDVTQAT